MLMRWVERTRLDILCITAFTRKRNTSEWRLLSDLSLGSVWKSGLTEIQDNLISHDFHNRTHCCFTAKSMINPDIFMSKAFPGTTLALKLQQVSMRVEALSDGVRRCWAAVMSEVMSANQKHQIAGPLANHSVQPDKRVMRGCEGRIHHLDRTQTETSRCGLYNRPPPSTADRTG